MSSQTDGDFETDDPDIEIDGVRVDAYRNLNDDNITVLCRESSHDVYDYGEKMVGVDMIMVDNPQFVVQPAGRAKVLDTGRKTVHAFVRGRAEGLDLNAEVEWNVLKDMNADDLIRVNYDPCEMEQFQVTDVVRSHLFDFDVGDPVSGASKCCVTTNGVECIMNEVSV